MVWIDSQYTTVRCRPGRGVLVTERRTVDEPPLPRDVDTPALGGGFDAFFTSNFERAARLAYLLTGEPNAAEDIAQEALARMSPRFEQIATPGAYLRTVVVNLSKRHGSERARVRVMNDRLGAPTASNAAPRELIDVIDALPRRQRSVVVLRYYEDLSEAEIAAVLKCRPGTVKSLAARALSTLRKELTP